MTYTNINFNSYLGFICLLFTAQSVYAQPFTSTFSQDEFVVIYEDDATPSDRQALKNYYEITDSYTLLDGKVEVLARK